MKFASALSFVAFSVSIPAFAAALNCSGYEALDANQSKTLTYNVAVQKVGTPESSLGGIPVKVDVSVQKVNNGTPVGKPVLILKDSEGFIFEKTETKVVFEGGMISVALGNGGITGTRRALDGVLTLVAVGGTSVKQVRISCPIPLERMPLPRTR